MSDLFSVLQQYGYLSAFWMTIKLTLLSAVGAMLIGTVVAIMRVSPVSVFQRFGLAYVTLVRNTPLTVILFMFYFALYLILHWHFVSTGARMEVHAFTWSVAALSVYHASFVAEAIRSGINTVPVGQAEAARAIGLNFGQSLKEVILPQAMRGAIAPLGNTMIALTKNTTVAATIGVAEAASSMKSMIEFRSDLLFPIFFVIAAGFVVLTLPTGVFFTRLSQRMAVQR